MTSVVKNNSIAATVDLVKDDEILDKEDNIIATDNSEAHNVEIEKEVFTEVIDEDNFADSLTTVPNQNVEMVQIEMQVLEDVLHHKLLDDNIEVVSFHNEEVGDVSGQDDINDNVVDDDDVERNSHGVGFKKRRHGDN